MVERIVVVIVGLFFGSAIIGSILDKVCPPNIGCGIDILLLGHLVSLYTLVIITIVALGVAIWNLVLGQPARRAVNIFMITGGSLLFWFAWWLLV